ncbi:tetratricopeptide repeat protein [Mycoavidus sp. SF9855]|uniref:tetratricopeptide repeat protein n=1 Tax=Mycoavidus sp. SF9855 TaxID=2968475 RepID=UPI00211C0FD2|nr:tetratricopeptide repeat protein [Mycoavidus sp. SF9855]UUM20966.1 tetratricopeptide repeat protein [Mycoavidus sp. SF9855]
MKTPSLAYAVRIWIFLLCAGGTLSSAYGQSKLAMDSSIPASHIANAEHAGLTAQLHTLEQRIKNHPNDVQARFKHATMLTQLGRDREAVSAFQDLIQRYPELPEPYNNLAYLHSKHGAYEAARVALETAVSASPDYALTQQNLGALYLQLAAQAYQQALELKPRDTLSAQRQQQIDAILAMPAKLGHGPASPLTIAPATRGLK